MTFNNISKISKVKIKHNHLCFLNFFFIFVLNKMIIIFFYHISIILGFELSGPDNVFCFVFVRNRFEVRPQDQMQTSKEFFSLPLGIVPGTH